ncbi:DNA translocase FtsK [Bacillus sp. KH172YL63]|nr:DNA translocase FtsK [Bacillus sp. KH172YL63]BCB05304.1 DNA translocase FtsK [Bacillus sp. KH172YL63]
MFVSWIKKLFGKLSDDDDQFDMHDDEMDVQSIETKRPERKNIAGSDRSRDVEARMTYQYPKGNFRFPIISDNEKRERPRDNRNRSREETAEPVKEQEVKNRNRPSANRKWENEKQTPAPQPKKSSKVEKGNSRPFTPTEIPSPIYGFRSRPVKKDESVEYELKKFLHNEEVNNQASEERPFTESKSAFDPASVRPSNSSGEENAQTQDEEIREAPQMHQPENRESAPRPSERISLITEIEEAVLTPKEPELKEDLPVNAPLENAELEASAVEENVDMPITGQMPDSEDAESAVSEESSIDDNAQEDRLEAPEEEIEETPTVEAYSFEESESVSAIVEEVVAEEEQETSGDEDSSNNDEALMVEEPQPMSTVETFVDEEAGSNVEETADTVSLDTEETPVAEKAELIDTETQPAEEAETMDETPSVAEAETSTVNEMSTAEQETSIIEETERMEADQTPESNEMASTHTDETQVVNQEQSSVTESPGVHDEGREAPKEEPPRRKRSHLPFNVLMLKQDKRQMNAAKPPVRPKQAEAVEEKAVPSIQEKSPEKVEEEQPPVQSFEEQPTSQGPVQGEEAAKSYDELSSETKRTRNYVFPEVDYLMPPVSKEMSEEWLDSQRALLNETLHNFNVRAKVVNVTQGPSVTRFEVQPEPGVKVNKITNLSDDIKLSLAAKDIRMEAPIPGKHTIGIEVPNRESRPVCISEVIASPAFQDTSSPLTAALGLDISGQPIVTDLSKMPHGLIAGATGSGKSVCINSILVSLLYKASPDELKLLLIDPKMVELAPYNRIPHLVSPVITDVKAATAALKWAVEEMERRYELFAHTGVRDIKRFNELAKRNGQYSDMLPYLVIVIDELADLMMMSPADVEEAICRIAQKARACGIHLIIATQRPSVDVITGLIKANVPTRVAFSVSSSVDSRTIIDGSGAERLLGKGDMLFLENGSSKPVRLQGTFVSDDEIDEIINHVREQREPDYIFQQDELIKKAQVTEEEDELFLEACEFVVDQGGASASSLQRRFRIGYNRAARLMEMMESNGIISESRGSKPRDVLISESELETLA